MDSDIKNKNEEISSLQFMFSEAKQRYDELKKELELTKHVKNQEVEKYKGECMNLKENISILEVDCKILREKEMKDQETIKRLLDMIVQNEREFTDKLVECMKLVNDMKGKMGNVNAVKKEVEEVIDEEMPKKSNDLEVVINSDNENNMLLSQLSKKRVIREMWKKELGFSLNHSSSCLTAPCQLGRAEEVSEEYQISRKRSKGNGCRKYTGRYANKEQRLSAIMRAEKILSNLKSGNPSCIKSMALSHVSGSFWLTLDRQFCKKNLSAGIVNMILEDENGFEFEVKYLGYQPALSGGWVGFAKANKLELYDALIFELCEPARFKVYIIKAYEEKSYGSFNDKMDSDHIDDATNKLADTRRTVIQDVDLSNIGTNPNKMDMQVKPGVKQTEIQDFFSF